MRHCQIKYGVPYGSILGPLHLIIYINDFRLSTPTDTVKVLYTSDSTMRNLPEFLTLSGFFIMIFFFINY